MMEYSGKFVSLQSHINFIIKHVHFFVYSLIRAVMVVS
jgi:hypothetical protein